MDDKLLAVAHSWRMDDKLRNPNQQKVELDVSLGSKSTSTISRSIKSKFQIAVTKITAELKLEGEVKSVLSKDPDTRTHAEVSRVSEWFVSKQATFCKNLSSDHTLMKAALVDICRNATWIKCRGNITSFYFHLLDGKRLSNYSLYVVSSASWIPSYQREMLSFGKGTLAIATM